MEANPDVRLTWSFLRAIAELWALHPGTYRVVDESENLIAALAQMAIRALAVEVRETASIVDQRIPITGVLTRSDGSASAVTLRDVTNKVVHGTPERVVVSGNDIVLHFVNSANEVSVGRWTEISFSVTSFTDSLHTALHVKPHDSERRDGGSARFPKRTGT
ncbi:hypothetical protein [Lapillicoccus sp.]|uniref:hypothetical protein n=1 Tax=Lapillicoccus sp. TaxID=1909287 RepID=UPI0025D29442|nr:hypothetical protein [Lapillicoccus sp.]